MDLKSTLNLPDPAFTIPMKADLPVREPEIQAKWDEMGLYSMVQEARKGDPVYVFHDGPPYTNGPIHIGTAMNKVLKDFAVRSRTMMGFRVPFVPGFDNHGLPIEMAVAAQFAKQGERPDVPGLRRACREHAAKYIGLQTGQFARLGVLADWQHPYTTMDYAYEAAIVRVFRQMVERGFVYRGLRPTLWSPTSNTALAETEIVYRDVESLAIHVKFPLADGRPLENPGGLEARPLPQALQGLKPLSAVIWTTTPWTIPANLALAFHPELEYSALRVGDEHWLVASLLAASVLEAVGAEGEEVARVRGSELELAEFRHPLYDRSSFGVLAEYVAADEGTGIVHTAPGHGRDDFFTGQRYGLPVLSPVDERGVLTAEAGEFSGVSYKQCDTVVVGRLAEVGSLLRQARYAHSYPHAERDEKPVIFRATEQWFVRIDHAGLRERMLHAIDQEVEWLPASGQARIRAMVAGRPDWCVSRQRPWGVGIPVFYGAQSGVPVLDPEAIECVARLIEREGSDAWYTCPPEQILPDGYAHPETGETEFRKETDVFDVWFDSGASWRIVLESGFRPEWREHVPADLYFEGSDQHRGWFNVSLVIGTALTGSAPYRRVATHGFVLDGSGQKMSKRLGNVVDPAEVCAKYGADVLRTWAAIVDYRDDAPCSPELLAAASESYRSIRNTLRFLIGNLADFDPSLDATPLRGLDAWVVSKCAEAVREAVEAYGALDFRRAYDSLHGFCVNEVSRVFAEAVKDTMYCEPASSPARRGAQRASWTVADALVRAVAPILPHTAEEAYGKLPGAGKLSSVHLERFAELPPGDGAETALVDRVLGIRSWAFAELEAWRSASGTKDTQDAHARLWVGPEDAAALRAYPGDLAILFRTAHVEVMEGGRRCEFRPSEWPKCERSRLRRADVAEREVGGARHWLTDRDYRAIIG